MSDRTDTRAGLVDGTPARPTTLGDQRPRFEVADEVAYFNTASVAPMLRGVREAGKI